MQDYSSNNNHKNCKNNKKLIQSKQRISQIKASLNQIIHIDSHSKHNQYSAINQFASSGNFNIHINPVLNHPQNLDLLSIHASKKQIPNYSQKLSPSKNIQNCKNKFKITQFDINFQSSLEFNKPYQIQSEGDNYQNRMDIILKSIPEEKLILLKQLFKARCLDLQIAHNQENWHCFLRAFMRKNKNIVTKPINLQIKIQQSSQGQCKQVYLDCSQLNLKSHSINVLNKMIKNQKTCEHGGYSKINLSKNLINPNEITELFSLRSNSYMSENLNKNLKALYLNNCSLGNSQINSLLQNFMFSNIKLKIFSLSSHDMKDRNQLTTYEILKQYILWNIQLEQLLLSNIQIKKNNPIFQVAKQSKSLIKLDLSKNTDVCGMCKNIKNLNLSRNNIKNPQALRVQQTSMSKLDISFNKIPFYKFQTFLLIACYPCLKQLILDGIPLNGDIPVLQQYLQRSGALGSFSVKNCQLTQQSYTNIAYGLQKNGVLQSLDLSLNKFPASINLAQSLAYSLQTCKKLKTFKLSQCQLKDEYGCIIFKNIKKNLSLQFIDISKNLIGNQTSSVLCNNLKQSFYNLMRIQFQQNFVKYDQIKQLKQYVKRNQHLYRVDLQKQKKNLATNFNDIKHVQNKLNQSNAMINSLKTEKQELQYIYSTQKLTKIREEQQLIKKQISYIMQAQKLLEQVILKQEGEFQKLAQQQQEKKKQKLKQSGEDNYHEQNNQKN